MHYIYLHGFASSPKSNKAKYFCDRFQEIGLELDVLDLNQPDFSSLTLTRQINQTIVTFPNADISITLIGSSFGALTAAWVAQQQQQVKKLILLAPAFGFPQSWYSRLEPVQLSEWKNSGFLSIYHYGEGKQIPLQYKFLEDAENYPLAGLKRFLPTMIFHGIHDEVVPIQVSRDYTLQNPQAKLIELDSDHGLNDAKERIWHSIKELLINDLNT